MSTPSKCCSSSQAFGIATGVLAVVSVAALLWAVYRRHGSRTLDPMTEVDKRIDELEHSLTRLQSVFGHAISD